VGFICSCTKQLLHFVPLTRPVGRSTSHWHYPEHRPLAPTPSRPIDDRAAGRWLKRQAGLARGPIALTAAAGIAQGLCGVAQAGLIAWILQRAVMDGAALSGLWPLFAALLAAALLRAGAAWASEALGAVAATGVKTRLRRQILDRLHALGPAWRAERQTGDIAVT